MNSWKLIPHTEALLAPDLDVMKWLNTPQHPSLSSLRGRVVMLHAFQMLCPGCVSHGIPQAQRVQALFSEDEVCILGLHTVFEHHDAMREVSLRAFLHEYRVSYPVGLDKPGVTSHIPQTMSSYQMRGTPSLVLIDRQGRLRLHAFGCPDDLSVGAAIGALLSEQLRHDQSSVVLEQSTLEAPKSPECTQDRCEVLEVEDS